MIQDRICKTCSRSFKGGPRAYYCPECRIERDTLAKQRYRTRIRTGEVRRLGSRDKCERCGKEYIVEGGLQRFCPDCQIAHALEYDYARAMPKYEANKHRYNPIRNVRRKRIEQVICEVCGKEFVSIGHPKKLCSDECRKENNRRWQREYRKKKKQRGHPSCSSFLPHIAILCLL